MRKRKPRIPCRIDGCETPIIYDRLMCRPCWMTLPSGIRKKHNAIWRELRPFINRVDNSIKNKGDAIQVQSLIKQHHASCDDAIVRANNIRTAKNIPADPNNASIKNELKVMGLI